MRTNGEVVLDPELLEAADLLGHVRRLHRRRGTMWSCGGCRLSVQAIFTTSGRMKSKNTRRCQTSTTATGLGL